MNATPHTGFSKMVNEYSVHLSLKKVSIMYYDKGVPVRDF